jgi:hypothetical protein
MFFLRFILVIYKLSSFWLDMDPQRRLDWWSRFVNIKTYMNFLKKIVNL